MVVVEPKKNDQKSPTLPSQNDTNNTNDGNRSPINKTGMTKGDSLQLKHPNRPLQDTPYFIPDPTNPDSLLGPMTKAELDLFHESRHKSTDVVDEAIFDPASGLYYLLQNRCHNDRTALPMVIYDSMTGTTCCYDKQLKQFFFVSHLTVPQTPCMLYQMSLTYPICKQYHRHTIPTSSITSTGN